MAEVRVRAARLVLGQLILLGLVVRFSLRRFYLSFALALDLDLALVLVL